MRGYYTPSGYRGLVDGEYRLFASERDYTDYYESVCADEDGSVS